MGGTVTAASHKGPRLFYHLLHKVFLLRQRSPPPWIRGFAATRDEGQTAAGALLCHPRESGGPGCRDSAGWHRWCWIHGSEAGMTLRAARRSGAARDEGTKGRGAGPKRPRAPIDVMRPAEPGPQQEVLSAPWQFLRFCTCPRSPLYEVSTARIPPVFPNGSSTRLWQWVFMEHCPESTPTWVL